MRPRGLVEPLDVASRAYFSAAQIEKAEAYRTGQLWLFGARMVIELGVLAFLLRSIYGLGSLQYLSVIHFPLKAGQR